MNLNFNNSVIPQSEGENFLNEQNQIMMDATLQVERNIIDFYNKYRSCDDLECRSAFVLGVIDLLSGMSGEGKFEEVLKTYNNTPLEKKEEPTHGTGFYL